MARSILTDAERLAWERFPADPDPDAIGIYFTLADGEIDILRRLPTPGARLSTAVAVAAIRWLGFIPVQLDEAPAAVSHGSRASSTATRQTSPPTRPPTAPRASIVNAPP